MVKSYYYVVTELLSLLVIFTQSDCCFGASLNNDSRTNEELNLFVVGGEVAYPDQFPYTVSIQQLDRGFQLWHHFCGGTIIAPRYVLTAAHCFSNRHWDYGHLSSFRGVGGSTDLSKDLQSQQIRYFQRIYLANPRKRSRNQLIVPRDIALILLETPWIWTENILPMHLPRSREPPDAQDDPPRPPRPPDRPEIPPPPHPSVLPLSQIPTTESSETTTNIKSSRHRRRTAIISGFGAIQNVGLVNSSFLRYMDLPIMEFQDCLDGFRNQTTKNNNLNPRDNFCTSTFTGQGACVGDSGGPLVMMTDDGPVIVGVVSFGMSPCGYFKNSPTVYTRVSEFVSWIRERMRHDEVSWTEYLT